MRFYLHVVKLSERALMLIGAIVLPEPCSVKSDPAYSVRVPRNSELLAHVYTSCIEVLGSSVLERVVRNLRSAGVAAINVIADSRFASHLPSVSLAPVRLTGMAEGIEEVAESVFKEYVAQGLELVVVIKLGPYAEFDLADLIRFHRERNHGVTRVTDNQRQLPIWLIGAQAVRWTHRTTMAELVESRNASDLEPYVLRGYVNHLEGAQDLRRLAVDAFLSRCEVKPGGREIRPGVWIEDGVEAHRTVRIVAPAYVGAGTAVQADTLITRFSNVERDCILDAGAVVEDTSVLKNTYVGRGLDVSHAVVDGKVLVHLRHNLAVIVEDPRFLRRTLAAEAVSSSATAGKSSYAEQLLAAAWSQLAS